MSGDINGLMTGPMNGNINGSMNEWMNEWIHYTNGSMKEWEVSKEIDLRTHGWMYQTKLLKINSGRNLYLYAAMFFGDVHPRRFQQSRRALQLWPFNKKISSLPHVINSSPLWQIVVRKSTCKLCSCGLCASCAILTLHRENSVML